MVARIPVRASLVDVPNEIVHREKGTGSLNKLPYLTTKDGLTHETGVGVE